MQIWLRAYGLNPMLLNSRVRLWLQGMLNQSLWPNIEISAFSCEVLKCRNQSQIRSSFLDCFSCLAKPSNSFCWKYHVCYCLQHERSWLISEESSYEQSRKWRSEYSSRVDNLLTKTQPCVKKWCSIKISTHTMNYGWRHLINVAI